MTQHEKVLRYLVTHPKSGLTIREGVTKLNINWTHKRIGELEQMGVKINRIDDERDGVRFRRYVLKDPNQERIEELLEIFALRRKKTA
jgi:hypothetical protein